MRQDSRGDCSKMFVDTGDFTLIPFADAVAWPRGEYAEVDDEQHRSRLQRAIKTTPKRVPQARETLDKGLWVYERAAFRVC